MQRKDERLLQKPELLAKSERLLQKPELLAPAGDLRSFYGAIEAGADAVYLGGAKFGARALAKNFSEEELIQCIQYAHLYDRKVYLTVNTLLTQSECEELEPYLAPLVDVGLDAVIVQDIGVLSMIRRCFSDLAIHASTQMTQTGAYGVRFLAQLGVSRVVLARELSLVEIAEISNTCPIETEIFVHGAMCYSYSGQCLFSSMLGERSANRGRCAQPCRLPYQFRVEPNQKAQDCYPLSMKDLCAVELLPDLIRSNTSSLKIEGRMKKAEYVAGVTGLYRKYLDRAYASLTEANQPYQVSQDDLARLSSLYIRAKRQDGYFKKRNGADMLTLKQPTYRETSETILKEINQTYSFTPKRKAVTLTATFLEGKPAKLTISDQEDCASVTGNIVSAAKTSPMSPETVKEQLTKLGNTFWIAEDIQLHIGENLFYSLRDINELRRSACEALLSMNRKHTKINRPTVEGNTKHEIDKTGKTIKEAGSYSILISTKEQAEALLEHIQKYSLHFNQRSLGILYVESSLPYSVAEQLRNALKVPLYIALPPILRQGDHLYKQQLLQKTQSPLYNGCLVRSMEEYAWLKEENYPHPIATDFSIPVWNTTTIDFWTNKCDSVTLSPELAKAQQIPLINHGAQNGLYIEKLLYGHIPMMISANCIQKTFKQCTKNENKDVERPLFLMDRYRAKIPIRIHCDSCINILYNSVPLFLPKEGKIIKPALRHRINLTIETKEQSRNVFTTIYNTFLDPQNDKSQVLISPHTTGHEYKSVQ
ncbi:MAG: U32 family peptidase [Lachnospiraceae bacterium]|jgi:putative protease|nr:U32 family peptidase [Lachnospiraceae bacterium]